MNLNRTFFEGSRAKRKKWGKKLFREWSKGNLSFYDHRIDELSWPDNIFWLERGVFARLLMKNGDKVLDLCCGDGYYSEVFWACTAGQIHAVDRNEKAIALALECHGNPAVEYFVRDILTEDFPDRDYDIVCFFEALEHFSGKDGIVVLRKIMAALTPGGALLGSTPLVRPENMGVGNQEHDNEFSDAAGLEAFLRRVFAEVVVFETAHPKRRTVYFRCNKR